MVSLSDAARQVPGGMVIHIRQRRHAMAIGFVSLIPRATLSDEVSEGL